MFGQRFLTSPLLANRQAAAACVLFQNAADCWYLKGILEPAGVWFMRRVCLISILNDNTAEGRKNASPAAARGALKWSRGQNNAPRRAGLLRVGLPNFCHVSEATAKKAPTGAPKLTPRMMMHRCITLQICHGACLHAQLTPNQGPYSDSDSVPNKLFAC